MSFGRHLKALLWKNWLLWRRKIGGSAWEILFPIILMGLVAFIRTLITNTDYPTEMHIQSSTVYTISDPTWQKTFWKDLQLSNPKIIPNQFDLQRFANKYWIVGTNKALNQELRDYLDLTVIRFFAAYYKLQVDYVEYDTESHLFDYISGNNYQKNNNRDDSLIFAVYMPENVDTTKNYNFTLYISSNFPTQMPDTKFFPTTPKPSKDNYEGYAKDGFAVLQYYLSQFVLTRELKENAPIVEIAMVEGKTQAYTQNDFMDNIGPSLALFILLIFIAPQYRFIGMVTTEKASRAREGMKIMGLKDGPYWVSWFIYYFGVSTTISLIWATIFVAFIFTKSSFFFLFLFVWLYGMSIFSYSLLICSFLQRPRVACILATLIHFITYFAVVPVQDYGISKGIKTLFSFVPNIGMALWVDAMAALESSGEGVVSSSVTETIHNYEVWIAFRAWIIMFFLLGLLALYLDNVIPKEYGLNQPWYFFVSKKYWCGKRKRVRQGEYEKINESEDEELDGHKKDFEAVARNIRELEKTGDWLKVRNLRKVYSNGKEAVKDVSLTMYKGQIFALLGHNGAGKTTTISILTGMYPATSGSASVFNLDMFDDIDEVRKTIGVWPQFDILFDQLTPKEHLELFCMFKGVPKQEVNQEVLKTLIDVDLEGKSNAFSGTLSGGQKRKLSVGIAMVGGSKIVLLDEPTSGMDLTARRKMWDMLKDNKHGKVLILTTHFMDEADILGDRIAIMAGGLIKCCGTSLFLKRRFGVGYNLIIAKENKDPNPAIEEFVFRRLSTAIKLSEVSSEITFQIPQNESDKFQDFFTELDNSLKSLRIKSYGVGVTTLEEVFLRVGRDEEESRIESVGPGSNNSKEEENNKENNETMSKHSKRSINKSDDDSNSEEYSIAEKHEVGTLNLFWLHFGALFIKRWLISLRQVKSFLLEIIIPIILIISGLALSNSPFFKNSPSITFDSSLYPTPQNLFYSKLDTVTDDAGLAKYISHYSSLPDDWEVTKLDDIAKSTNFTSDLEKHETNVFDTNKGYDKDINNAGSQLFYTLDTTNTPNQIRIVAFSNGYGRDTVAFNMQNILESTIGLVSSDIKFSTKGYPFPLTATAVAGAKAGSGSIVAFLFAIAFSMIPASVVSQIVAERESNVKHQQMISGASLSSYWISNYVVDFMRCLIPISVAISFVYVFNVDLPDAWILFLLFAACIHPFTYATSFLFKQENNAQTLTILLHVFCGGFLAIAVLVLQSFDSTRSIGNALKWPCKIIPSYSVIFGVLQITTREIIARATGMDSPDAPLSFNVAGGDVMFLCIDFVFWWILVILFESGLHNYSCRRGRIVDNSRRTENLKLDDDVLNEANRWDDIAPEECSVLVQRLRKVYGGIGSTPVIAVRDISFGLEYGECFALLGVNGAGKSTTFKSMTGDVTPSDGKIYIDGFDLSSPMQFSSARKLIGYWPQDNAIFEGMTVKEHLIFYSKIKGILRYKRMELIEKIMKEMDLKEFEKVQSQNLSGGNKRKLSVAMAMIGNPPIVFLDEPSTGMDPRAKRFMWSIISRISTLRKKSTVILTTHSMEEAEALCTKMGIMVNGRFKCYGSSQHIKNKFGTGYEVEIKIAWPTEKEAIDHVIKSRLDQKTNVTLQNLNDMLLALGMGHLVHVDQYDNIQDDIQKEGFMSIVGLWEWALLENAGVYIKQALEEQTPKCNVLEHYNNFFKFRVDKGDKSLGFFFGFMERLKGKVNFEEYAVSQTTLEQIFNAFALEQDVDEDGKVIRRRSTVRKDAPI